MPLDPQAKALLDSMAAMGMPPMHTIPIEQIRQWTIVGEAILGKPEPVGTVEDREIPGPAGQIPIRICTPEGTGPFPVLVYFHGGGWVLGNIQSADPICRTLTNKARCITVSVEYRLAPEHKFPAAPEDCYAATQWVAGHAPDFNGDPARIAVGGESAGGNLAAVVSLMARDRGGPKLVYQLLIYPATGSGPDTPSMRENAEGYMLTREDGKWFLNHYLSSEADRQNPYLAPLKATDLHGLPPALVITGEFDPLRDEGEYYAARLRDAGVPVTTTRYDGMIHGFVNFAGMLDKGKLALDEAARALRLAFSNEVR